MLPARPGCWTGCGSPWAFRRPGRPNRFWQPPKTPPCQVGPLTLTISETLADGHLAYLTVNAAGRDGAALVYEGSGDLYDPVGTTLAKALNHPDILAETTLVQAARKSGLPLYCVMAWLQLEEGVGEGTEMMDALRQKDGSLLLVDMLLTNQDKVGEKLNVNICLRVWQIDPVTMKTMDEGWEMTETRSLTVHGVTARKDYLPQGDAALNDSLTITGVTAEQTCAGVYVTVCVDMQEGMTCEELLSTGLPCPTLLDGHGQEFPQGISLSGGLLSADGSPLPESGPVTRVQYRTMIGTDALPESMTIAMPYGNNVTVK